MTNPRGGNHAQPQSEALLAHHLSAGSAVIAELVEQFAESTAARVAQLVSEQRPAKDEQTYYTAPEAAEYLRCCVGRIYNLTSSGRLKGRKDGGRLLFTRTDLDALVEASP